MCLAPMPRCSQCRAEIESHALLIFHSYPTAARATAQNVLFNVGRAVGAPGPLAVGTLAAKYSFNVAIALLVSIYVLDIMATVLLIPELKGKELL
jgi:hypothetical protein